MTTTAAQVDWPGLEGIISRTLPIRDLDVHILEAGDRNAPLLLLLHGYPELAYSWRDIILPLSRLGYYVVAPDLRGYGRTKPLDPAVPGATRAVKFDDDMGSYRILNLVHDVVALVSSLGYTSVAALIGHDFGSAVAGHCVLARPDLFRSVIFMSAPFTGAPPLPFATDPALHGSANSPDAASEQPVHAAALIATVEQGLEHLNPPRKHYMHYFSGSTANADILGAPQGLHAYLRAYFHIKSADWEANDPRPVPMSAEGLANIPHYYIMPRDATMADVARANMPPPEEVETKSSRWLPDDALAVYASEFGRTGFQGALNWYRSRTVASIAQELSLFSGKNVDVPAMYLSGKKDWGVYQFPGALDKMQKVCTRMEGEDVVLVEGAGHWVQQEQPEEVVKHIRRFLGKIRGN